MGFSVDIAGPTDRRSRKATVTVLDDEGKAKLTDTADLASLTERRKLAGRLAERLGVEAAALEAPVEAAWAAEVGRQREREQAEQERHARREEAGAAAAVTEVTILDQHPET